MSSSRNERLDRLASEVKKGGGLPLPSFFSAILHELLDNGPADDDRLTAVITDMGGFKSRKVAENWGHSDRDQWEFLTSDLVEQLASYGYIVRNGDNHWSIGEKFQPGVRLETIRARKGFNTDDGVVVWTKEERDQFDQVRKTDTAMAEAIKQPRGRPHSPAIVSDLRASYAKFGPLNRVVVDAHGRTLDGRHRREIDRDWPVHQAAHIETDEQAIAAILELDRWHNYEKLSDQTVKKLTELLGREPTQREIKRGLVSNELHRDAARSNSVIAEAVGVGHPLVAEVRAELEKSEDYSDLRIHCYISTAGRGGGKTKHRADCWCGKGTVPPPEPKEPTDDEKVTGFMRKLFDSGYIHRKNKNGREELVARLKADTGIERSHGALEQRWDKLVAAEPAPAPSPRPVEVEPEPEPVVESLPHEHRYVMRYICECGKEQI